MISSLRSLSIVLLLLLTLGGGCGKKESASVPPADPRIVGVWTLQGGDYPLTNEYLADGTVVQQVFGKKTDPRPFRIEGKFLVYSVTQPDGRVTDQKEEFTLTQDTLTFIDSPTSTRVFRRQK